MSALAKIVPKPRGTYDASATYNTLDIVRYGSKVFMCRQDNIQGVTPVDGLTWMFLVEDGSGADTFEELDDTNISDLQDGQIPIYNSQSGKWENEDIPVQTIPTASASVLGGIKAGGSGSNFNVTDGVLSIHDSTHIKSDSSGNQYIEPGYTKVSSAPFEILFDVADQFTVTSSTLTGLTAFEIPIGNLYDSLKRIIPLGAKLIGTDSRVVAVTLLNYAVYKKYVSDGSTSVLKSFIQVLMFGNLLGADLTVSSMIIYGADLGA